MTTSTWPHLSLLLLLAMAAGASGQQTLIVDAANGPGTQYTDLPPAVAAAQPGDTLLVRTGTYLPVTTNKGITILGQGGARIAPPVLGPLQPFEVVGLPAGQTFVMKGMQLTFSWYADWSAVRLTSCVGTVHFENVSISLGNPSAGVRTYYGVGLDVSNCAAVTLTRCSLYGPPALRATTSTVALDTCSVRGHDSISFFFAANQSAHAVELSNAAMTIAFGQTQAGQGILNAFARPAITMTSSALTLAGDATTLVAAGSGSGSAPGVATVGGSVQVDPAVVVTGVAGGGAFGGTATVVTARMPALQAVGAGPGGILSATLYSPVNDLVVLIGSRPWSPLAAPPFGTLWLDPTVIFFVQVAFQGASEHWTVPIPIAPFATRGLPIALHGLSAPGFNLVLSTPSVVVLH